MFRSLLILPDGIPSPGQLMPALTLAVNIFSSITQAQSEQQAKFQPRNKISHNYGMDLCK